MQLDQSAPAHASPPNWLRRRFGDPLVPLAGLLVRWGMTANAMTLVGFGLNVLGAVLLSQGWITAGGLFILAAGPLDGLDGAMARQMGQPTAFGAFVDSVTDRWSEMVIFLGLLYYFQRQGSTVGPMVVFVATIGTLMVSYTKARAESLGFGCDVGLLTRLERFLVLGPLLVLDLPWIALWIIAVFANVTALQRAVHVQRQARARLPGVGSGGGV